MNTLSMTENKQIEISVVVPLHNEQDNFHPLYSRLSTALSSICNNYELIFVNDGSFDNTFSLVKKCAAEDTHVKYLSFSRNFGHQNAIMAGIVHARGNAISLIDGDLQDPPELIPELYKKMQEGFHVVYAKRKSREGENFVKKFTAKIFYRLLKKITSVDIPVDTGDFRIFSRQVAKELIAMDEKNKFLRGQIAWLGFKQTFVEYERKSREQGETKFTFRRMLRFAFDGITSFSNFPLQIATFLGFLFSFVAFFLILYALYSKFVMHQVVTGWTSIMVSTMFLGGIQLLCIGIIGEYISRIGTEVKKRPSFIIEESNIDDLE